MELLDNNYGVQNALLAHRRLRPGCHGVDQEEGGPGNAAHPRKNFQVGPVVATSKVI